jgi:hypothetical protein
MRRAVVRSEHNAAAGADRIGFRAHTSSDDSDRIYPVTGCGSMSAVSSRKVTNFSQGSLPTLAPRCTAGSG